MLKKDLSLYTSSLTILMVITILRQYSLIIQNVVSAYGGVIDAIICILFLGMYVLFYSIRKKISVNEIAFIFLMVILFLIFRKQQLFILLIYAIAFMVISPERVVYVYRNAILFAVIINTTLALVTHHIYNSQGEALAFGFGNQNTTAFYLSFLIILFSFYSDSFGKLKQRFNFKFFIFYLIIFLLVIFLFNDMTAALLMVMYAFLSLLINKTTLFKNQLFCILIVIFPFFLLFITYWLAMNYGYVTWTLNLDKLLSGRLNIWHYYFSRMPIDLISNNRLFVISAWGNDYTPHQGLFDGSYAYILYIFGFLFSIFYTLGIALCNYKLIKYKKYLLLSLMIGLELVGFSENQMFSYAYSFASVFAILSFNKNWLRKDMENK